LQPVECAQISFVIHTGNDVQQRQMNRTIKTFTFAVKLPSRRYPISFQAEFERDHLRGFLLAQLG
jgi:hypothetical protein